MTHPLVSAYLKLDRARKHLKELDFEVREFAKTDPYRLEIEPDPETGQPVVRFRCDRPLRVPLRLGLIAGDVIHNLRSALDHVVYQLALAGGGDGERSQFPIFEDADEYRLQKERLLKGVVDGQRAIIDGLQPYHVKVAMEAGVGERDPLAINAYLMILGRLDNLDKHRLLLPGVILVPFRPPKLIGVTGAKGSYPADWLRVEDGAEFFRITEWELLPGVTNVEVKSDHAYTVGFGDPGYAPLGEPGDIWMDRTKGLTTKADLGLIAGIVERVIGMFDPYFHEPAA